jgi:hypothetical protein
MQTSLASDEDVVAGLRAGAYYYLTKPFTAQALFAIVAAAARDRHGLRKLQVDVQQASRALSHLLTAQFSFQTPDQVGDLATVISKATPCPERSVGGLVELMLNAVEHGNLGISYAEKSELLLQGHWPEEIARRLALPEHVNKQASIRFERRKQDIRFTICDEGAGFDWRGFLELSPERAFDLHGRGIAMCKKMWFDQITYLGNGNEVLAVLRT